jgi:hypothetical protein
MKSISRVSMAAAFVLLAALNSVEAQSIIYGTPQQPIHYNTLVGIDVSYDVDLLGGQSPDFRLISSGGFYGIAGIAPEGSNSVLVSATTDPNGFHFFAALSAGAPIGSSLDPGLMWYDKDTDENREAIIGYGPQYPYFEMAYVGIDLYYDGDHHFGWMRISDPNPPIFIAGEILDWAYETTPNTPILAGAVPEPGVAALFGMSAFLLMMRGKSRACDGNLF